MATRSTADAESDRRLAAGQYRAVVRPDRRFLQAAPARGEGDRRRRRRPGHQGPRPDPDRAVDAASRSPRPRPITSISLHADRRRRSRSPQPERGGKKGPRYTPVSRRQDRPNAILWLVRNHPELKDSAIMRLVGTTKSTISAIRDRTHWNAASAGADGPGDARPVLRRPTSISRSTAPTRKSRRRSMPAPPCCRPPRPPRARRPKSPPPRKRQPEAGRRSRRQRRVRQAQAARRQGREGEE